MALQLDPTRPNPLMTPGIVYAGLDQYLKASDYFRAAQARGLEFVDLYNNRAASSFSLAMVDQAITLLRYSLQLDPEHPESRDNLGIAYSSKGLLEGAQRQENAAMGHETKHCRESSRDSKQIKNYFFATFLFNSSIKSIMT